MAKTITSQNFEEEVLKSEKPILLDFWATWCGPCMRQGPIVEALAEEGYNVGKIDVDQEMGLAQHENLTCSMQCKIYSFKSGSV